MKFAFPILLLIFSFLFFACNVFLQPKSMTIKGQLVDEVGKHPIEGIRIKVNGTKDIVLSNKDGYFTSLNGKQGDNELLFLWQGREVSILLIELTNYQTYDFGQIKIDAPMTRPVFLKQSTSQ